jgi:hypothetical protein
MVNNESYGDKRLTPIFEDYVKERNSLGFDYLLFSSKVDSGEIDLFDHKESLKDLPENVSSEEMANLEKRAKEHMENDVLFYGFNTAGKLALNNMELSIKNPDFVVNTTISPITKEKKQ